MKKKGPDAIVLLLSPKEDETTNNPISDMVDSPREIIKNAANFLEPI
jgi:hypothetical protein